jgi:hypothetical protein
VESPTPFHGGTWQRVESDKTTQSKGSSRENDERKENWPGQIAGVVEGREN